MWQATTRKQKTLSVYIPFKFQVNVWKHPSSVNFFFWRWSDSNLLCNSTTNSAKQGIWHEIHLLEGKSVGDGNNNQACYLLSLSIRSVLWSNFSVCRIYLGTPNFWARPCIWPHIPGTFIWDWYSSLQIEMLQRANGWANKETTRTQQAQRKIKSKGWDLWVVGTTQRRLKNINEEEGKEDRGGRK